MSPPSFGPQRNQRIVPCRAAGGHPDRNRGHGAEHDNDHDSGPVIEGGDPEQLTLEQTGGAVRPSRAERDARIDDDRARRIEPVGLAYLGPITG